MELRAYCSTLGYMAQLVCIEIKHDLSVYGQRMCRNIVRDSGAMCSKIFRGESFYRAVAKGSRGFVHIQASLLQDLSVHRLVEMGKRKQFFSSSVSYVQKAKFLEEHCAFNARVASRCSAKIGVALKEASIKVQSNYFTSLQRNLAPFKPMAQFAAATGGCGAGFELLVRALRVGRDLIRSVRG
ncbi:hypothetical protein COB21_04875 [Candidatus Aerophobetes bacterium]|uniref:Uncharacterized protein n=1 Tax=Aerophobetes bacterium TaxID=2030807 RepID=A0A2A4X0M9_UNCAE|nr:MAG: hypothetical protein COB21_04875 [Candidatus Aerophobetes bacterium]